MNEALTFVAKVCVFFAVNRDEALTTQDMATKFSTTPAGCRYRTDVLVQSGYLTRKRDTQPGRPRGGVECIYTAGPELVRLL